MSDTTQPVLGSKPDAVVEATARRRATIFPISMPRIPDSVFPITSTQDLMTKLSRLYLVPHLAGDVPDQESKLPPGYSPPGATEDSKPSNESE